MIKTKSVLNLIDYETAEGIISTSPSSDSGVEYFCYYCVKDLKERDIWYSVHKNKYCINFFCSMKCMWASCYNTYRYFN